MEDKKIIKSYIQKELTDETIVNKDTYLNKENIKSNFGKLKDIPLNVKIVFDKTIFTVEDLYNFQDGQIIRLDRESSKPLELYVGEQRIGICEVVSYDQVLGIRLLKEDKEDKNDKNNK